MPGKAGEAGIKGDKFIFVAFLYFISIVIYITLIYLQFII